MFYLCYVYTCNVCSLSQTSYLLCRTDDKPAILLYLLKNLIDISKELTVVFLATRHHVEYMKDVSHNFCFAVIDNLSCLKLKMSLMVCYGINF